jgi:hypothetical protein
MAKKTTRPVTDDILDVRILGDKKLRDATYADLKKSAEEDQRAAVSLNALAKSKREISKNLKR